MLECVCLWLTVKWLLSSACDGERTLDEGKELSEPEACRLDAVELVELVLGRAGNTDAILIAMADAVRRPPSSPAKDDFLHRTIREPKCYLIHPCISILQCPAETLALCSVGTEKLISLLPQLNVNKQP